MLTQFNKIVLLIATIVLIIMLILLYIFLSKSLFEDSYPPVTSDCPDYWDISLNSDGTKECINNLKINSGRANAECNNIIANQFGLESINKEQAICNKFKWAKQCKITWDGITNNSKPCDY